MHASNTSNRQVGNGVISKLRSRVATIPKDWPFLAVLLAAGGLVCGFIAPRVSLAKQDQEKTEEIVANLYAGRVVVGVAKDGIVVATLENPIEPATRPPMIVSLANERVAVILGAGDWWLPDQQRELARFDQELPQLPTAAGADAAPHLATGAGEDSGEATDIERLADRLHFRLDQVARHIHGDLRLGENEPILEVVLADYAPDYGPEVWLISYSLEQDPEQGDFWQTRALQPQFTQLWPPEKGAARGLVEVSYPAEPADATLATLIGVGDSRVGAALSSAPGMQAISETILDGKIEKLLAVDVAAFLRTSLRGIAAPGARMVEAEVNKDQGVGWFITPPPEVPQPGSELERPAGAPSLLHPGKPSGPGRF
ncbi:MAG: hypothetical protein WBE20_00415 [Candidatus Acidiferrales bacterium]